MLLWQQKVLCCFRKDEKWKKKEEKKKRWEKKRWKKERKVKEGKMKGAISPMRNIQWRGKHRYKENLRHAVACVTARGLVFVFRENKNSFSLQAVKSIFTFIFTYTIYFQRFEKQLRLWKCSCRVITTNAFKLKVPLSFCFRGMTPFPCTQSTLNTTLQSGRTIDHL